MRKVRLNRHAMEKAKMLKAIELENFKAFGERCRIELAPITLIFGENSAGKSSILQALHVLKQTRVNRSSGVALLPAVEDGFADIGNYSDFVFDHECERSIHIRLELEPTSRGTTDASISTTDCGNGFELVFSKAPDRLDIDLNSICLYSSGSSELFARFAPTDLDRKQSSEMRQGLRLRFGAGAADFAGSLSAMKCVGLSERSEFWNEVFLRTQRRRDKIAEELLQLKSESLDDLASGQQTLFDQDSTERERWLGTVDEAITFYQSDFSLAEFISRMKPVELESIVSMDGFIPIPSGRRTWGGLPELETFRRYGPSRLRLRDLTLNLTSIASDIGKQIDDVLQSVYPLGPFRHLPQRLYSLLASHATNVGYDGKSLPDLLFRKVELVEATNEWMDRLEIGYSLRVDPVGDPSRGLYELRLLDLRRNGDVSVAISDVGFGISQVLPLVVQCIASQQQLITIEQPEVHIHPRLQADLGDLLADSIAAPRYQRFIIETHSEHLMLRLQRLVREGRISADDVSVLYVRRGPAGSTVVRLRLDTDGDFVDEWPGGFFPERLKELF